MISIEQNTKVVIVGSNIKHLVKYFGKRSHQIVIVSVVFNHLKEVELNKKVADHSLI